MVTEIRTEIVFGEGRGCTWERMMRNIWSADNILFLDLGVPYTIKFSLRSELSTYILCTFFCMCITL